MNPSNETVDLGTTADGTRRLRGKLARYTDFTEDKGDLNRRIILLLICQSGKWSPAAGRELAWSVWPRRD